MSMSRVPYGPAIQQAIARGNLKEMKSLVSLTEKLLTRSGDLPAVYQLLKIEIAKMEKRRK